MSAWETWAYSDGEIAAQRGGPRASCPYPNDAPLKKAWEDGWDDELSRQSFVQATNQFVN